MLHDQYGNRAPTWYKPLKLLFQNQSTNGRETWHVASGTQVLTR